jgi:nitroreductase
MDALEAILTRRSVRRYTDEQIDDETTQKLLAAAMNAPSAANEQPWEFIVIRDRAMLDAIPTFSPFASMVKHAPLGILVCADTRNVIVPGFWVEDCSAATQNLLLAARALGLGAVWTGVYPMDGHVAGFTKHCQLPEGVIPLAFVVVGHPAEEPPAQNRFSEHRIHSNVW